MTRDEPPISIDELSRLAGERYAREAKEAQEDEGEHEPRRARPRGQFYSASGRKRAKSPPRS